MIKEAKEAQDLFGKGDLEGLGTESSPKTNEWTKYICTFERTSITGRTI